MKKHLPTIAGVLIIICCMLINLIYWYTHHITPIENQ
jgi:hypothetical protein